VNGGGASRADPPNRHVYLGFLLAGLAQPMYMCTSLTSARFPDLESTAPLMLHIHQLGFGCAFFFGALLVKRGDDVLPYFHFLGVISAVVFVAVALQFDDVPPTPPPETVKIVRGRGSSRATTRSKSSDSSVDHSSSGRHPSPKDRRAPRQPGRDGSDSCTIPLLPSPASYGASFGSFDSPMEMTIKNIDTNDALQYLSFARGADVASGVHGSVRAPNTAMSTKSDPNEDIGDTSPFPNLEHKHCIQSLRGGQSAGPDRLRTGGDGNGQSALRPVDAGSLRACFARHGFSHCGLAFSASSITLTALSTFMDRLVTLSGENREYVFYIGGMFQLLRMLSSILCKGRTDKPEKYYISVIGLLALSALTLALCGANVDSGTLLLLNLLMVAVFVSPVQTLCSELGAKVVSPLSENTALVNQQVLGSILSAASIPILKALKEITAFYLLVLIHAFAATYFGSFNVRKLRQETEEQKKRPRVHSLTV